LAVSPEALGIPALRVRSYLEAIGVIAAHRAGVSPAALSAAMVEDRSQGTIAPLSPLS
jgi:hypothetical protein